MAFHSVERSTVVGATFGGIYKRTEFLLFVFFLFPRLTDDKRALRRNPVRHVLFVRGSDVVVDERHSRLLSRETLLLSRVVGIVGERLETARLDESATFLCFSLAKNESS